MTDYLSESYANNILTSASKDTGTREENFHLHRALQDIVNQLSAFAQAGHLIIEAQQQDNE